jgi:hypothetical protein
MAQTTWDPDWWTDSHASSWARVKHAVMRDWAQTKGDLTDSGVDLNQGATDTIRQALGTQPIPRDHLPNPGPRHGRELVGWPSFEAAVRYGHGARLHYKDDAWDETLMTRLREEWQASNQPRTWDEVKPDVEHGWHSVRPAL